MKKLVFLGILLISIFSLSFCKPLPMSDGVYIFQSFQEELVLFTVNGDSLALTTEDNNTIFLELDVDDEDNYFYFCNDQYNNWIIVFFEDPCTCVISNQNDKFLLYNINPSCK